MLQRFLEASGKVTKPKSKATSKDQAVPKSTSPRKPHNVNNDHIETEREINRPGTSASTARKVDELFQVNE